MLWRCKVLLYGGSCRHDAWMQSQKWHIQATLVPWNVLGWLTVKRCSSSAHDIASRTRPEFSARSLWSGHKNAFCLGSGGSEMTDASLFCQTPTRYLGTHHRTIPAVVTRSFLLIFIQGKEWLILFVMLHYSQTNVVFSLVFLSAW